MKNSLIAVGVGGLLLGGTGGFLMGGKSSASNGDSDASAQSTKTGRAKVVAVEQSRRPVVGELSEIYKEPSQTARVQGMLDFYSQLDPNQYEEEAAKLDELPFSERILASYLLFSQWAEVDPLAALSFTDSMGRNGFFVKPAVLQSWAANDPQGAADYLKSNPRDFAMMGMGGRGQGAAATIATEWARQDPDGALAWAKSLEGRESSGAVANVIKQVAASDPEAALVMAAGLEEDDRGSAYESIAKEWAREDWSAMESWANTLPTDQRDAVLAEGVEGLAQRDPEEAAAKLMALSEGKIRDGVFDDVVENWAQDDPRSAMSFLLANGSEAAQQESMREAMGPLARTDPSAALGVINSLDDNGIRDRAVSSYVFNSREGDFEETVVLAATIGDDDRRARSVGMAATRWFAEDEDAATSYFQSSDLIDAQTLKEIQDGGGDFRGRGGRGGGGGGRGR